MSNGDLAEAAAAEKAAPIDEGVLVGAEGLIVGRALQYPIFDDRGTLLLAEGATITPEFKQLLRDRHIRKVRVNSQDATRATVHSLQTDEDDDVFDKDLTSRLDEIIDSGLLFVVNSESALNTQMRALGCTGYDQRKHETLIERNQVASVCVDNLMQNAVRGKSIDAGEVTRLVAEYLSDMKDDVDSVLAAVLETVKQGSLSAQCVKVSLLSMAVGIELGYDAPNVRNLGLAAMVHDWGMARVPAELLNANRRLTEEEFFEIGKHPIFSLRLLERLPGVPNVVPMICYQVHERPNGNGYPNGRTGERIHPLAKILAVADTYHALIAPRPYRPALMRYAAMECLLRMAQAGDVDAQAVRALLRVQSLFPIGSYVALSDGSVARVHRRNGDKYTRPIVRVVQDAQGRPVPPHDEKYILDLDKAGLDLVQALPTPGRQETEFCPDILTRPFRQGEGGGSSGNAAGDLFATQKPVRRTEPAEPGTSLERYTEKQKRQVRWLLDMLDNSAEVANRQYDRSREHQRKRVRSVIQVCIPTGDAPILDLTGSNAFRAMGRDISPGGLSFVHPEQLTVRHLIVTFPNASNEREWYHAEIVRSREVGDADFWEYGVAFRRQLVI